MRRLTISTPIAMLFTAFFACAPVSASTPEGRAEPPLDESGSAPLAEPVLEEPATKFVVAPSAEAPPPLEVPTGPILSAGCGKGATGAGVVTTKQTTALGKARTYHLSVPAGYDANEARALVLVLHGAGDRAPANMRQWFAVEAKMESAPIAIYPQALERTRDDGTGGNVPRWDYTGPDDLALFDALLAEIGDAYCIDLAKVFSTGFSSGGNFSQQLACKRSSKLRAFGAVAGPGPFTATCDGAVAGWMTHDLGDTALPIAKAHESRAFWSAQNGCGETWVPDERAECSRKAACSSGKPLVYCETTAVGHDVPSFAVVDIAKFFDGFVK